MPDEAISCRVLFLQSTSPFGELPPEIWTFGGSPARAEVEIDKLQFVMLRQTGGLELTKLLRQGHVRVISGDEEHALAVVAALADSVYPLRDRSDVFDEFAATLPVDAAFLRATEAELRRAFKGWSARRPLAFAGHAPPVPFIGLPSFCDQSWCADILSFRASLLDMKPPRPPASSRDPVGWMCAQLEEALPTMFSGPDAAQSTIEVRPIPNDLATALRRLKKADWARTAKSYVDAPGGRAWTAHLVRTGAAVCELATAAHRERQKLWLWTRFG